MSRSERASAGGMWHHAPIGEMSERPSSTRRATTRLVCATCTPAGPRGCASAAADAKGERTFEARGDGRRARVEQAREPSPRELLVVTLFGCPVSASVAERGAGALEWDLGMMRFARAVGGRLGPAGVHLRDAVAGEAVDEAASALRRPRRCPARV